MAKPTKHRGKWRIRWIDSTGKRQSEVFTERSVAVSMLRRRELEVEEIAKGLRPLERAKKSFDQLADYWLEHRTALKRDPKDDESIIRRSLRPAFSRLGVRDFETDVGRSAIDRFLVDRQEALDPKTVSNHATLLISMLNLAVELSWLDKAPRVRKPRVRLFNRDYSYLRTPEEMARFLSSARRHGDLTFTLYATALYTGAREGELAALRWEDVNFETRLITIQRSFDGPTKADDLRYIPILDGLLEVLRAWRLKCPGTLLFPNQAGRMHSKSARIFQEVLKVVLDDAGFPKITIKGKARNYITFHGLRHSFASAWMARGGDLFRLQRVLGHKSIAMTQRYSHLAPNLFTQDHGRLDASPLAERASNVLLVDFTKSS